MQQCKKKCSDFNQVLFIKITSYMCMNVYSADIPNFSRYRAINIDQYSSHCVLTIKQRKIPKIHIRPLPCWSHDQKGRQG